ncbi:S-layer homology domain-containing protein [bacterium]|nr:S-layer homology domain-containing protein [bacterium]
MKHIIPMFALSLVLTTSSFSIAADATVIKDIPAADPTYPAVLGAVQQGYLPLYSDNEFRPEQSINRKELAIILDKLLSDDTSQTSLSKIQIQELLNLARSFKAQTVSADIRQNVLETEQKRQDDEQKALHQDISALHEKVAENTVLKTQIEQLKKENNDQHLYMWIGIGTSLLLGLIK